MAEVDRPFNASSLDRVGRFEPFLFVAVELLGLGLAIAGTYWISLLCIVAGAVGHVSLQRVCQRRRLAAYEPVTTDDREVQRLAMHDLTSFELLLWRASLTRLVFTPRSAFARSFERYGPRGAALLSASRLWMTRAGWPCFFLIVLLSALPSNYVNLRFIPLAAGLVVTGIGFARVLAARKFDQSKLVNSK